MSWATFDNAAWLTLSLVSGTNSGTVTASVHLTRLAAGTYSAIITVAVSGSTNCPQQIPVSLTLSVTAANTATLTWNASTESDLARFKVYRGTASGTYEAPLTTLPKTTTSYIATGLQTGTIYFFVITAYDRSGNESTFFNEGSKRIFNWNSCKGKKCGRARTLRTFTRSGNHPLHTTGFPISASPPYSVTNLKPTAGLTPRLHRLYKGRVCYRFPSIEDLA